MEDFFMNFMNKTAVISAAMVLASSVVWSANEVVPISAVENAQVTIDLGLFSDSEATTTTLEDVQTTLLGDINVDGEVKSNDLLLLKTFLLGLEDLDSQSIANSDFNQDGDVKSNDLLTLKKYLLGLDSDAPEETTTTTTEVPETTTTTTVTTTATTKETTSATTTSSSPSVESEFGVDYEIAERAKNLVVNCSDGYDNTAEADDLFLEVLNSYRVNHGLVGCQKGSVTYEWQTYFSDRFLRHLDRCNVIMHSVLGSRGEVGVTEIITVQKNSMTVWEAFRNFMESPDHRSAIDDSSFNGVNVLITFFEGSPEQGSQYNYTNNNNVFCLVNFRGGGPSEESWYGSNIEDFEAFLSCEINLSAFYCSTGDAGIAEEKVGLTNNQGYKLSFMRRVDLIHQYSAAGLRWDGWWSEEVERCANIIMTGFSKAMADGSDEWGDEGKDTDDALLQYLAYLQDPWSCLED